MHFAARVDNGTQAAKIAIVLVVFMFVPLSSATIQFGGCEKDTANCLPISEGWNYMVRLYRRRKEILEGTWKPSAATPVK